MQGKCCEDRLHITNFRTKGYAAEMGNSLAQIFNWLGDLAHGKRILDYDVVCISSVVGMEGNPSKKELAKLWGSDPVHLTTAGYQKVVDKLVEKAEAHQMRPLKTTVAARSKNPNRTTTERRPGLSRRRWGQDAHNRSTAGRSGKRSYSGSGSGPSKRHF